LDGLFGITQAQENGRKIARMGCGLQDATKSGEIICPLSLKAERELYGCNFAFIGIQATLVTFGGGGGRGNVVG
jgi:hypothetical protein